jgi:YegS/Rv2252/BmrU family lipid kinase
VLYEDKKVLFIVNKNSGTGFSPAFGDHIIEVCERQKAECKIEFTQGPGHATELARTSLGLYQTVVAVGGDGTVNEVAQALLHSSVAMGIIPKGSGNGLARHLGIPIRITDALHCLFTSQTIGMDTFTINGKLSLNVSGIGFDGHIANLFSMEKKRGLQGYTRLAMNEFIQFQEFDAEIAHGGELIKKKAFVIALANSSQYGNNALIAPAASVRDGLLHISILKKIPAYRLDFIYSFFAGTIAESAYCEILEARDVVIKLPYAVPFHIDGEPGGRADHFVIEMIPASLQILAPVSVRH